jgi:hypothetical protein
MTPHLVFGWKAYWVFVDTNSNNCLVHKATQDVAKEVDERKDLDLAMCLGFYLDRVLDFHVATFVFIT